MLDCTDDQAEAREAAQIGFI